MRSIILLAWVFAVAVGAQNLLPDPGGEAGGAEWGLYLAGSGSGNLAFSAAAAHSGSLGAQVVVNQAVPDTNWKIQLQPPLWTSKPNSIYRLTFWAKGPGAIHVGVSDVDSGKLGSYAYIGGFGASLGADWKPFSGLITTYGRGGPGAIRAHLYLGAKAGVYQFDDFSLTEVAAPDPGWYGKAQLRIDSLRQQPVKFRLLDSSGNLLNGSATAHLVRHDFAFGTALASQATENPIGDELWYRQTAAGLFNAAVFENDFKWPTFERTQDHPDTAKIRGYLKWGDSVGVSFRGHALVWAIQNYGFQTFWGTDTSKLTCGQIAANIKAHILRDVSYYKGRIKEYDVWNEALHEGAFFAKCRDDPLYAPQGWALQDSAFEWAHRADPAARLFINDYNNVDGGGTEEYYQEIRGMLDRKVPVGGIGIQCHFGGSPLNLPTLQLNMDRLASLGLPIKVTEYDNEKMSGTPTFSPATQAAEFSKFVRFMFSHPAVDGIMLWGFWDSRHWIAGSNPAASPGLYTADMTAKPVVDSLTRLWKSVWTTQELALSTTAGLVEFTGYPGTYQIELDGVWHASATIVKGAKVVDVRMHHQQETQIGVRKRLSGLQVSSVHGILEVSTSLQKAAEIEVFDMSGNRLAHGETMPEAPVWKSTSLANGMYLVRVRTGQEESTLRVLLTGGSGVREP